MKLQNKLFISYLLACIIPLLLGSQVIYRYSVANLETTLLEMMNIFNSQIISNIDTFIGEYDNITKSVLVDQEVVTQNNLGSRPSINAKINNQLAVRKILLRLETLKPEIDRIMLFTADGDFFQYGKTNETVDIELLKENEWFQDLINSQQMLTVTALHDTSYYTQDKNRTIISIGRVILDSGGRYSGILLMDLRLVNLIQLNDEFLQAKTNYNIKLTVTNQKGHILYNSDTINGETSLKEIAQKSYTPPDEKEFIILSEQSKYGDLIVYTEIPRSDLLLKIGEVYYITLFITVLCFLIALMISAVFSRSITKPIKVLQKSMKSAEKGKYVEVTGSNLTNEMGDLVKSYNQMITKTKALIEDVYLAEIKQKNARFLALQTQINPHMLYNTFESIRMKALVNGDDETAEMIKILSRLFRASLSQDTAVNSIQNEVSYVEDYINLQNIRFENRFLLEIILSDEIRNSRIIALVLQPLVENCIEHGGLSNNPLQIIIAGNLAEDNNILLTISDNGIGIVEAEIEKLNRELSNYKHLEQEPLTPTTSDAHSIGLKNIAERLYLHYGSEYYVKIVPVKTGGICIEILVPNQQPESEGD